MIRFIKKGKNRCSVCGHDKEVYSLELLNGTVYKKAQFDSGGWFSFYYCCGSCVHKKVATIMENLAIPQQDALDLKMKETFKKLNFSTRDPKYRKRKKNAKTTN